jgi:biopolymer transport protein ExbD
VLVLVLVLVLVVGLVTGSLLVEKPEATTANAAADATATLTVIPAPPELDAAPAALEAPPDCD